jgi:hypothetical protein
MLYRYWQARNCLPILSGVITMPMIDNENQDGIINFGLALLDKLAALDKKIENGISSKEDMELRQKICSELRGILWNLKPMFAYYNRKSKQYERYVGHGESIYF